MISQDYSWPKKSFGGKEWKTSALGGLIQHVYCIHVSVRVHGCACACVRVCVRACACVCACMRA